MPARRSSAVRRPERGEGGLLLFPGVAAPAPASDDEREGEALAEAAHEVAALGDTGDPRGAREPEPARWPPLHVYYTLRGGTMPFPCDRAQWAAWHKDPASERVVLDDVFEDPIERVRLVTDFPGRYWVHIGQTPGEWFFETNACLERLDDEGAWVGVADLVRLRHCYARPAARAMHLEEAAWLSANFTAGGLDAILSSARRQSLAIAYHPGHAPHTL